MPRFTGRILLAAAAALMLDVAKGDDRLTFTEGFNNEGINVKGREDSVRKGIFEVSPVNTTSKTFKWMASNLTIDRIILYVHDETKNTPRSIGSGFNSNRSGRETTGASSVTDESTEAAPLAPRQDGNQKRQFPGSGGGGGGGSPPSSNSGNIKLEVSASPNSGQVTVPDLSKIAIHGGMALYFEAEWPNENPGRSYSPAFAVINPEDDAARAAAESNEDLFRNGPFRGEQSGGGTGISTTTVTSTASPTSVSTAGVSSIESGLPVGAIAGIAAGCGFLGLLLVAFLVWYYLRKRRQKRDLAAIHPYGSAGARRTRTEELMAEKEANAGGDVAPHSPYSDADVAVLENHPTTSTNGAASAYVHRNSGSLASGAAAPLIPHVQPHILAPAAPVAAQPSPPPQHAALDIPPSYTPYKDRPAAGAALSTTVPPGAAPESGAPTEPNPGRSTPHGLSAQYAHLVEEGMTADEIRRLEEEERALDAAIERAVRRPTG